MGASDKRGPRATQGRAPAPVSGVDFAALVERAWPEVRRRHLFPELPAPAVVDGQEAVTIEMRGKQVALSGAALGHLSGSMAPEDAVSALLDHGTAHHTVCPWDFDTHLSLYASLKPVLKEGALIKQVLDYFMDVVVDTHCVREVDSKLADVYARMESPGAGDVVRGLYERLWGVDLNVTKDAEMESAISRLSRIPYLDRGKWAESVRSFASVMTPFIQRQNGEGPGQAGESGMMGPHGAGQYTPDEIEEALSAFSGKGFYAFRAMVEDFREELEEAGAMPGKGIGQGRGTPRQADLLYYMKRAESFSLPIRPVPMQKVGGLYPHAHAPWELGRPVHDIDPWTSFGKVLPGLSQVWRRREGETHGLDEGTPDCVVVIDSSGSMANPCEELSFAVLGAGCAADAYLKRRRKVAVYNFSDAASGGKEILPFTQDRTAIYRALCRYFGGGTQLHLPDFAPLSVRRSDLFVITDMQISNLDAVIDYVSRASNRVTAVHVGRTREAEQFRKSTGAARNIVVYPVESPEDIPRIVLAEVEARFTD